MAGWSTTHPSRVRPVADEKSITRRGTGIQIDWTNVSSAYLNATTGKKELPAFAAMGETLGGRAGFASPRVDGTNPATCFLETVAVESDPAAAGGGMYGAVVTGNLYENWLPDAVAGVLAQDIKDELAAAGGRFYYQTYGDAP